MNSPSIHRFVRCLCLSVLVLSLGASASLAGEEKQIANAVQRGSLVYAYDARGAQLFTVSAGDGITGYTSSTLSVRRGSLIYTYDSRGRQLGTISAGTNTNKKCCNGH